MATINILCLHLMIIVFLFARSAFSGGYYHYATIECVFSYFDLSDVEYINTYHFNKDPFIRFNSTVGKFVGFTKLGVEKAEMWNNDPIMLANWTAQRDRYCKPNAEIDISAILSKAVQPEIKMRSEKKASGPHPAMLMCSAYDFYPKEISVYWLRDGKPVTTDVTATEEMVDGDWYYQVHSHLQYTPKSGEKISCVVEHVSLKGPKIIDWDPSVPESGRNMIAIGASGLVLGIILSAAGFIYYKMKSSGWILVPS